MFCLFLKGYCKMAPRNSSKRREKKRLAEKKRREIIKSNPELHNEVKDKARERYYKRKSEGKIIPIHEMEGQKKRTIREQNRLKSRLYRKRKKEREERALQEDLINYDVSATTQEADPLLLSSPPTRLVPAVPEPQMDTLIPGPVTRLRKKTF